MHIMIQSHCLIFVCILTLRLENQIFGEVGVAPDCPYTLHDISRVQLHCLTLNYNLAAVELRTAGQLCVNDFVQFIGIFERQI